MKHDRMVELKRAADLKKKEFAIRTIRAMLDKNEQVTIPLLVKRTGLSRNYFYTNAAVKAELDKARRLQAGKCYIHPAKLMLDKALLKHVQDLEKEIQHLRKENRDLREEYEKKPACEKGKTYRKQTVPFK